MFPKVSGWLINKIFDSNHHQTDHPTQKKKHPQICPSKAVQDHDYCDHHLWEKNIRRSSWSQSWRFFPGSVFREKKRVDSEKYYGEVGQRWWHLQVDETPLHELDLYICTCWFTLWDPESEVFDKKMADLSSTTFWASIEMCIFKNPSHIQPAPRSPGPTSDPFDAGWPISDSSETSAMKTPNARHLEPTEHNGDIKWSHGNVGIYQ